MSLFNLTAILVVISACFSYFNYKVLRFPTAIGLMALALASSLLVVVAGSFAPGLEVAAEQFVASIDLNEALLRGMLGLMLFAGALHVNFAALRKVKWPVLLLATGGVMLSTFIVGGLSWLVLSTLGVEARFVYCLLFGALISPTDPIAVLSIMRQAGVPHDMEIKVAGESLFNDGVGVVVFLAILGIATGGSELDVGHVLGTFAWEALGGGLLGLASGWLVYRMLRTVDHYQVEVLLSLALAAGGYALANSLHMSGPIAVVVSGLLIGNAGRAYAMSDRTVQHIDAFWELIDEILNSVLFVLIGLEVLIIVFTGTYFIAGLLAIPVVLMARFISVWLPLAALSRSYKFAPYTLRILTWGGLRGGISVALALSLPMTVNGVPLPEREIIIVLTYMVVVFSILVQGLSVGPLVRRWLQVKG